MYGQSAAMSIGAPENLAWLVDEGEQVCLDTSMLRTKLTDTGHADPATPALGIHPSSWIMIVTCIHVAQARSIPQSNALFIVLTGMEPKVRVRAFLSTHLSPIEPRSPGTVRRFFHWHWTGSPGLAGSKSHKKELSFLVPIYS